MSRYDYLCPNCEHIQEEVHGMRERPEIACEVCGVLSTRLIAGNVEFAGVSGRNDMYHFVDVDTTGKPIEFHGKRQWREHLKQHGLTDDISQGVPKAENLKPYKEDKESKRKAYKEALVPVLKEKGILQKYGK